MRRRAFVAVVLALLLGGLETERLSAAQLPVRPLLCPQVATTVEPEADRMVCLGDLSCPNARAGVRYSGCVDQGPMPGAVLLMRGLPLSASRATMDDLVALRGVGPGIAGRLVEARKSGPFCSEDDLRRVPGIGAKRASAIGAHLQFDDPLCEARRRPVDSARP